ncbi:MAG: CHAT domain-containing protein [Microcoleus sp. PH2017_10_PVI_O_A]|uniref:CHAT domain-containing protein n=1 Tax=unclassified Microcoleus TaxID=2642155 RepID=UPI001D249455|nr:MULTISPECIES: CHAT domain-containing tetratricopeptide repeat protein [unclassified Microcoleus]TAE78530.1 MAG: CHAT domain-containing protein [Oscillatoriales cyanobacterium]MCC3408176.1 CHAT domain-containing protein [Microcoleus sp. PH2017_10_PVI_O_A]MCC3462866.1 CHAT domain-containing protein [Microcoleus sp. PH2017_11_PCY_U_A]MCC3480720.1 CHAT domain-containing protein [Microcoleus sp. PH2017_12_PCY_D_A]MCC3561115.1 CHAT domain-containing protein [Microcoleus sp. PH2017_27_LUM_O_A]
MNQPRRQAYLTLIESLLTWDSDEQTAILQANLELLDDDFAEYLREWATETLPNFDADKAKNRAQILYNLNNAFSSLQQGSRRSNIEIAIACLDIGLTIFTRAAYSEKWAINQNSLGAAYSRRMKGDKGDNLETAIKFYEAALQVRTRQAFPEDWAMTQNNLAIAYYSRIKGDKGENLERAIKFYEAALQVYTRQPFPENWAMIQKNLAATYTKRIKGDRGDNLERAIKFYEAALQVRTRAAFPENWADTQNNLATAYSQRIKGDKDENIERALAFYEAALQVRTREAFPENWADTQNNLGEAYRNRIKGDKGDNLERAIAFYEAALQVRTRAAFPQDWADTQNNLAIAYYSRIKGDKGDNLERAIAFYEAALQVRTREAFPEKWADTQNNLAAAYRNRIKGDKGDNLERAIAFYEAALQVRTHEAFPEKWADTQNNLANAYFDRIKGDRGENIERAIKCYEVALEFRTPTTLPLYCLQTGRNLGNLGWRESLWETAIFGYEKAIEAVEQTREWVTSQTRKRQIIEENLNIYEKMMQSCINHQQYHKAVQTVERSKSRYLVELFTNSEIYPKTATDTEKQQLQNLRRQIATSQQLLETETPSPLPLSPPLTKGGPGGVPDDSPSQRTTQTRSLSPESFQQQKAKLETTLQQLAQLLEQIKQREPEFSLTQKVEPIDITQFQQTLNTETAIVEWYIGGGGHGGTAPTGGFAFIITRDSIKPLTYTTTEIAELETWKNNYLDEYRDKNTNQTWQNTLSQKLEKLSEILRLNEIIAHISPNCKQLILVPHRYLHLFPLHALPFTSETRFKQKTNFRGYLLDGFPAGVKYAPSLQLLQLVKNRITTRNSPPPNQQQLFALQNPTEDLFNADMEVETIKTRFNPHQILLKKQATKTALNDNRENLSNTSYLHFSCHGVFNFDNPLLSSLVLADSLEPTLEINPPQPPLSKGGLEENTFAEGGLEGDRLETKRYVTLRSGRKAIPEKCLTLREIFAELQLPQCNLVTLSACETGLTDSTAMTDEYIGLPSGFLYAGSMNVVSSLWAVDDFATAILMIKFYQELPDADSVALALNAAQNWMRGVSEEDFRVWVRLLNLDKKSGQSVELWLASSSEEQPFREPKYWAAFCATGY